MDSPFWIYCVGLSAQVFYTGRVLLQWYLSEKHHKVESPGLFWVMSIMGSMILFIYGMLRQDFSIIFGEFLSYYIYMWNISAKGLYKRVTRIVPVLQALLPLVACIVLLKDIPVFVENFMRSEAVPVKLLLLGTLGQFVYKMRFVYQWFYSVKRKESMLPLTFWLISVAGSVLIITYALIRHDWVLLVGQFGIIPAIRNIMISLNEKKNEEIAE